MSKVLNRADFTEPTIVVVVNDIWNPSSASPTLGDCACGFWRVGDSSRAKACKWLMAVYNGLVVGVWLIERDKGLLLPSKVNLRSRRFDPNTAHPRQRAFALKDAPSALRQKFISADISSVVRLYGPYGYIGV